MKKIVLLLMILVLSGCSTKFVYKNLDWLTYWYLDDYVDLTQNQKEVFDSYLKDWLDWHRREELPRYVVKLEGIKAEVVNDQVDIERLLSHRDDVQTHWQSMRERIVPDIVSMAPMLESKQIASLFDALEERNLEDQNDLEEHSQKPMESGDRWIKRSVDRLENWVGQLTDDQQQVFEELSERYRPNREHWIDYRRVYQEQLEALFEAPDRGGAFQSELTELLLNPEQFRSDTLKSNIEANTATWIESLSKINALLTDKQRDRLVREIDDQIKDLQSAQESG